MLACHPMCVRHKLFVMLAATAFGLTGLPAAGETHVQQSGGTYHKPVCPKPAGDMVMRCHAHVVTDSKGNPVETAAPSPPVESPIGKQPNR